MARRYTLSAFGFLGGALLALLLAAVMALSTRDGGAEPAGMKASVTGPHTSADRAPTTGQVVRAP